MRAVKQGAMFQWFHLLLVSPGAVRLQTCTVSRNALPALKTLPEKLVFQGRKQTLSHGCMSMQERTLTIFLCLSVNESSHKSLITSFLPRFPSAPHFLLPLTLVATCPFPKLTHLLNEFSSRLKESYNLHMRYPCYFQ